MKSSWFSGPDYLTASMEFAAAANKYRAAGMLSECCTAWLRTAEVKQKDRDLFGAGRAYESAAALFQQNISLGGTDAAAIYWRKGVECFRLAGKGEIAVKLIFKLIAVDEKAGNIAEAKASFEDIIDIFQSDEKDHELAETYKQYIGFLVRSSELEDALRAIDSHITVLIRLKHTAFVCKEILAKVVLCICLDDMVRADEALNAREAPGWYMSKECEVGMALVAAYKEQDSEAATLALQDQILVSLQVDVARLAKRLKPPAAAGGPSVQHTNPQAEAREEPKPLSNAELMM